MTNSLVVDGAALSAVVGRVATVADEVTSQCANQLAAMSAPIANALTDSAIGRVGTSPQLAGELQRLGAALHDWIQNVRRSAADLAGSDEVNAHRFG